MNHTFGKTATLVLRYAEDKLAEAWAEQQDSEGPILD